MAPLTSCRVRRVEYAHVYALLEFGANGANLEGRKSHRFATTIHGFNGVLGKFYTICSMVVMVILFSNMVSDMLAMEGRDLGRAHTQHQFHLN
jgi:hypothetical protein